MPIDPSIADLTWLLQPGDAGSNLARGAAVGSQIAHQRMQNAALAERVMEFERTFPLQQALQKQEQEMNAAKLQGYLQDRQMEVDAGLAFAALRGKVDPLLRTGNIEDAQNLIIAEGADNALLLGDPRKRLQTLYDFTVKSQEAKTALINAKNAGRSDDTAAMKNAAEVNRLGQVLAAATASGDPAAIAKAKQELANFQAIAVPTEFGINNLTAGTRGKLQQEEMTDAEALRTLGDAIMGIRTNPEAIGVRGKIGAAVEKARGQLNPNEPMATPITDTQQKAALAFSRVAPALRVDTGNMSRYELEQLEAAGSVLSAQEAPQTALNKLANLQNLVVARQLRVAKTQGKPPTAATLREISPSQIKPLLAAGLLDPKDDATLLIIPGNQIEDLLKSGLLSPADALRIGKLYRGK